MNPTAPFTRRDLGGLQQALDKRLETLAQEDAVRRIWAGDHTFWKDDPAEITDRLGWLTLHDSMRAELPGLRALADECAGFQRVLLLGMGGSSLAPEVLSLTYGGRPLVALDTTHPAAIQTAEQAGDLARTLFIVASKSGTTVETLSQFAYFYDKLKTGDNFIAITDPGTPLETLGKERGFRRVFLNPPELGGRYSALSLFGLAPAALIGLDPAALLDAGAAMAEACRKPGADNPGLWLGALLGEAALQGRDKLTLLTPPAMGSFGAWVEQLIAESTGKEGRGILPVPDEPLGSADKYGADRLFVSLGLTTDLTPVAALPAEDPSGLGGEFFRWEFAIAVAGHVLGIHPFDQPNVEEAKDAARKALGAMDTPAPQTAGLRETLDAVQPGDYLAILAYLPRTVPNTARLQLVRRELRDKYRVATTLGFGPRYLHSTGQLHKGGPSTGVFIEVVDRPGVDVAIPGQSFSFRQLLDAQGVGDLEALRSRGQRVTRLTLEELEAALA